MNNKNGRSKTIISVIILLAVVVALLLWGRHTTKAPTTPAAGTALLPGIQTGEAPWVAETIHLRERLKDIGLPALAEEGTVLHIHQHLDIFVDSKSVAVPEDIGINQGAQFISPLHVHDLTGVIHVESPTVQTFTLGQFFDVWGVKLTNDCIGGYCTSGDKTLKVFVNGALYSGNPRDLTLEAHQEIFMAYGTSGQLPSPIPASYAFPEGE